MGKCDPDIYAKATAHQCGGNVGSPKLTITCIFNNHEQELYCNFDPSKINK